jgi:hypothetical protein
MVARSSRPDPVPSIPSPFGHLDAFKQSSAVAPPRQDHAENAHSRGEACDAAALTGSSPVSGLAPFSWTVESLGSGYLV